MIEVLDGGRLTSIQDRGRSRYERYGVPPGGAADWFSAAVATRLVGNVADAALLEITAFGPDVRLDQDATIAMTGGDCAVHEPPSMPSWTAVDVPAGTVVRCGQVGPGLRSYLAFRGGIDVPVVLGGRSLCVRGSFGGGFGRPLRAGDRLPVGRAIGGDTFSGAWSSDHRLPMRGPWEVSVIPGPHLEAFARDALDRLTAAACRVTPAIDRMGLRLETPGLHVRAQEMVTTPVTAGAIQVTPSGELVALLVDHPTTGGYPVLATVISAALPLLAQARPGDTIRFRAVDQAEAARAMRRLRQWLE